MRTFRYEAIRIDDLSSTDLRDEALGAVEAEFELLPEAYRVFIDGESNVAEAIYYTALKVLGFAWGAPADFYDAESVEDGISQALDD